MGTTFKCNKCEFTIRVSSQEELDDFQKEHKVICEGTLVSIWKNYDKMTKEEKEKKLEGLLFKYGVTKKGG